MIAKLRYLFGYLPERRELTRRFWWQRYPLGVHQSAEVNGTVDSVLYYTVNFLVFGIVFHCEDRSPDLTCGEAVQTMGYKYKQQIKVHLLWWRWSWIIRSNNTGHFWDWKDNQLL